MVSAVDIFLDLPAFQLAIFFLFWSLPLGAILGKIKVWRMWKGRDDAYGWYSHSLPSQVPVCGLVSQ
jgi:hypothetical protein